MMAGVHPTLAGVVLGLITPVRPPSMREEPLEMVSRVLKQLRSSNAVESKDTLRLQRPLQELRVAHREILPPVSRVQMALHPWVAYGIMPIFALANAGVELKGTDISAGKHWVLLGIGLAFVVGKPLGIVGATWVAVGFGWCRLAEGVSWGGVWLVGLLAGIGFTMSIFIAMLTFADDDLLKAAKLGVLLGSFVAATVGLAWGTIYVRRQ
ncbi:Na+:H+ antiporter, NhaA family [Bradyrhizobium brasilense]|uniref:Putative Na(+)/H(+) antiporter NhaA homolog n=1 Tax=Bradyrhizobium brasilense TaxID=1419277 RepID=A0A1G7PZT3_9BRAD|nr:Na+:H+ antiporter, NhaA family [Bradyrhizobium brasilense]